MRSAIWAWRSASTDTVETFWIAASSLDPRCVVRAVRMSDVTCRRTIRSGRRVAIRLNACFGETTRRQTAQRPRACALCGAGAASAAGVTSRQDVRTPRAAIAVRNFVRDQTICQGVNARIG